MHLRVGVPRVYTSLGTPELEELRLEMARLSGLGIGGAASKSGAVIP